LIMVINGGRGRSPVCRRGMIFGLIALFCADHGAEGNGSSLCAC